MISNLLSSNCDRSEETTVASFLGLFTFFFFFLFLAFGNLLRVIPLFSNDDSIVFAEPLLYGFSLITFLFQKKRMSDIKVIVFVLLVVVVSYIYGAFLWGFRFVPMMYALRLFGMVLSGVVVGKYLFVKHQGDFNHFMKSLLAPYKITLLIGSLLFIYFPYSQLLWLVLERFGVHFQGDPHIYRYVSVYFDPNYYSVIGQIPLLCSLYLSKKHKTSYLWALLFFASIIISWSRSGIATLGALMLLMFLYRLRMMKMRYTSLVIITIVASLFMLVAFSYDEISMLTQRFSSVFYDESALARYDSWKIGMDYVNKYPLLGIGYHFLSDELLQISDVKSVDSSILSLVVSFGVIPSVLILGGGFLYWIRKGYAFRTKLSHICDKTLMSSYFSFCMYVLLVVVFASLFNNLLFYPYWLVPIIVIFQFFHEKAAA